MRSTERPAGQVHSISAVPASPREDHDARLRHYLVSMSIRTICFVLAGVFLIVFGWTAAAWICVGLAAVLPYPAVVFANNVNRRVEATSVTSPARMLGPGASATAPRVDGPAEGEVPHR